MTIKQKLMYLGNKQLVSKKGELYNIVALMDLEDSTTYKIFCSDDILNKIKDYKLYNSYDFDLKISKNERTGSIGLSLI